MTDTPEQKKEIPKLISRKEYIANARVSWEKARWKAKIGRLKNRIYKLREIYGSIDFNYKNPKIIIK